ncbi:MAG: MFS transporter [Phycisphaerae bacterium]
MAVNNELHAAEVSEALNEVKFSGFHLRTIITAGMGFFTSAYDLAVIGTAIALFAGPWMAKMYGAHPTAHQKIEFAFLIGLIGSISLFATFLGALFFGAIADKFGRKRIYGIEAALMAIGAVGSAFAGGPIAMLIWRTVMGFGIGGDYPLSAVIMSEYANRENRGKMVGMVFSGQALGFLAGPVIALTMLAAGVSHELTWRILLGLGAIPAAAVIILRRTMPESPRWMARAKGQGKEAAAGLVAYSEGAAVAATSDRANVIKEPLSKYFPTLIGTAGCWFLLDYVYYGNTVCMPQIINQVAPHSTILTSTAWNVLIFGIFAVAGYVAAFMTCDKLGRKFIQILGFAMMAVTFGLIGLVPQLSTMVVPFILVFGISYFFTEFGPNVTTFILAAELYPVNLRTTGHGISAGLGKFGAFLGVFLFPVIGATLGFRGSLLLSAGLAVLGVIVTVIFVKEPAGKSLEEAGRESDWEPAQKVITRDAMQTPVGASA